MNTIRMAAIILMVAVSMCACSQAFATDCSSIGDDASNDALVSSLQQQAANAEARAGMSQDPNERRRWEDTANAINMQAQSAQSRNAAAARAARAMCEATMKAAGVGNGN